MQAFSHVHLSFRPGFCSSLRKHTPGPHHPWTPSFRLCVKTGSPATNTRCGFPCQWSVVDIACPSAATAAPMGGCPASRECVLNDHVGINKIILKQARRKSELSSKNTLTWRKSSIPTRRLSSANVKSINSLTTASVVGASRLHAFSKATLNKPHVAQ